MSRSVSSLESSERKRAESRLALQYAVTEILSESNEFVESVRKILEAACESLDWEVGALWMMDSKERVLRNVDLCHSGSMSTPEFDELTKTLTFKEGVGLPGRIWARKTPVWIDNVVEDEQLLRAEVAAREGLHGGFGFPIALGNEVLGIIEFFGAETRHRTTSS